MTLKTNVPDAMSFAYSLAGRDKERLFVVLSVEGEFALICDGKTRKVGKPKRKKLRHLRAAGLPVYGGELTNRAIAAAIKAADVGGSVR